MEFGSLCILARLQFVKKTQVIVIEFLKIHTLVYKIYYIRWTYFRTILRDMKNWQKIHINLDLL